MTKIINVTEEKQKIEKGVRKNEMGQSRYNKREKNREKNREET